jgi:peroxiredoxin
MVLRASLSANLDRIARYTDEEGIAVKLSGTFLVLAASALLLASCGNSRTHHVSRTSLDDAKLKPAPDFSLKDASGATVKLSDYRGKVVLLNFWATWCGPCKIEIPWFMDFEQQYKNKGFEVLGVAMDDEGWSVVKPYVTDKKINYRVLLGNDSIASAYGGIDSLPTTFVINQNGKIVSSHIGLVNKDDYLKEIEGLLNDSNESTALRRDLPAALLRVSAAH